MFSQFPESIQINFMGMLILLSWAVSNIIVGGVGWKLKKGVKRYFHQMNLFWNLVNLAIAIFAVLNILQTNYNLLTDKELIEKQAQTEYFYLLNGFLDILYIAVGFLLIFFSKKAKNRNNMLKGYGRSIILQGSFLLVFDFMLYNILNL